MSKLFRARHAMGPVVRGPALVADDGFSARYDLDRIKGTFSRPAHKLAGTILCRQDPGARHRQGWRCHRLDAA